MANVELRYTAQSHRRPLAAARGVRVAAREPIQPQKAAPLRPAACRVNAGQLIRSACLLLFCLGLSYLPRGEKLALQGSVVQVASVRY